MKEIKLVNNRFFFLLWGEVMIKNVFKLSLFLTIVFVLLVAFSKLFTPRDKVNNGEGILYTMKGFYELEDNTIDVMFLGSSSVYRTVSPMILWEDMGVTSYDYGIPSARVYMNYYFIKDVLRSQKPKVIFADVTTAFYPVRETEPARRKSFDYMQWSRVKYEMMNDPAFDYEFDFIDKVSILFPLLRYKERRTRPNIYYFFEDYHSISKGFIYDDRYKPSKNGFKYMENYKKSFKMDKGNTEYMLKAIDYCKKNNIDLVLTAYPNAQSWNINASKGIEEFAKEHNVKFLELNTSKSGLDWSKDTGDEGLHTNILGSIKTTKYVEEFLKDNYNLESHKNDSKYSIWNKDYTKYKESEEKAIRRVEEKAKKYEKK